MPVLKTESHLPAGYAPEQLGQAAIRTLAFDDTLTALGTANPNTIAFALVSYLTSPLTVNSTNHYVVFVPPGAIASAVASYAWEVDLFVDVGLVPIPLARSTSSEGVFEYAPPQTGQILVTVRLQGGTGQELGRVTMLQTVVPFSDHFQAMVAGLSETIERWVSEWRPSIRIGNAKTTQELVSDLYPYIVSSVEQPIDGKPNQIPWQLLAAIAYREMFFSPKETPTGTSYNKPDRTRELNLYRAYLNDTWTGWAADWTPFGVSDWSLGICQMQPQTLATFAPKPGTNGPYTAFLEEDKRLRNGAAQNDARVTAYLALTLDERVDLFNLLRFPKSHLRMCNIYLQHLKNRKHRGPPLDAVQLMTAEGDRAIQVIATEYNQGPTTSPWEADAERPAVGTNDYGLEVHRIVHSAVMAELPALANLVTDIWGVVLSSEGLPLADVRVDLYETYVVADAALLCRRLKDDHANTAAPTISTSAGTKYRVLEVVRDYGPKPVDLVKLEITSSKWAEKHGWIVAREGATRHARLGSSRVIAARTNAQGKFLIRWPANAPVKLRFVKEPDARGIGYFDGESAWCTAPSHHRVTLESAPHMVREADFVALLKDWEDYEYSELVNGERPVNYPSHYFLGEDHDADRPFNPTETSNTWIDCNSFTQALITHAWFEAHGKLDWTYGRWALFQIIEIDDVIDWFGPITSALAGDGKIRMALPVTLVQTAPGKWSPPPRWSLIQGWHVAQSEGHSFIIADYHPGTGKVLVLESNKGALDGPGLRGIGRLENEQVNDTVTPNRDRLWIEKATPTWAEILAYYAVPDTGRKNPIGIARLKIYDLAWSGAETL